MALITTGSLEDSLRQQFARVINFDDYKLGWSLSEDDYGNPTYMPYLQGPNNEIYTSELGGGLDEFGNIGVKVNVSPDAGHDPRDFTKGFIHDGKKYDLKLDVIIPPPTSGPSWTKRGYDFNAPPQPVQPKFENPQVLGGLTKDQVMSVYVLPKSNSLTDFIKGAITYIGPLALPYLAPSISAALAPSLGVTGSQVAAGALLGAGTSAAFGGDPLKGAILGGIGSFATANFATDVGKSLGIANEVAARTVGNAVLSSGLSGLQAAALGGDVVKSMLSGATVGAISANAEAIANAIVGGQENLQNLIENTNITLRQAQAIVSNTLAGALVAEVRGEDFLTAVRDGLVSGGLSTATANSIANTIDQTVAPATRNLVFNTTKGIADTTVRAGLNNQDIKTALEQNAPNIVSSALIAFDRDIQAQREKEILDIVSGDMEETSPSGTNITPTQPPSPEVGVEVAGPVSPEILGLLQSMPLTGERIVSEEFIDSDDPEIGGRFIRRIQGTRNDGSTYSYDIATFEDGMVIYSTIVDNEVQILYNRPDLKNSVPGVGDVPNTGEEGQVGGATGQPGGVVQEPGTGVGVIDTVIPSTEAGAGTGTVSPPIDVGTVTVPQPVIPPESTILFDLRQYGSGSPTSPNAAVLSRGGLGTGGANEDVSFIFVGKESGTNNEQYSVNGKVYTLYVLPNRQVLISDQTPNEVIFVELDQTRNIPKITPVDVATVPADVQTQIEDKQIEREILKQQIGGSPQEQPAGAEGATGGEATGGGAPGGGEPTDTGAPTQPTEPEPQPPVDTDATLLPVQGDITLPPAGGETGEVGPTEPGEGDAEEQLPPGDEDISDEDLLDLIRDELFGPGAGEEEGEGEEEGAGPGTGEEGEGPGAGEEGEGVGGGGEGGGGEGEGKGPGTGEGEGTTTPTETDTNVTPSIVTILRRPPARAGEAAPYRVTGMDESGILGRKQPLFGGDEDLQRAEWNRRSLRLRRLLGL